jgi:hypothetical protein
MKLTTLTFGSLVRLSGWTHEYATLFTAEGYARKCERDQVSSELPSAMYGGAMLCSDPGYYQSEKDKHSQAVVIEPGVTYEIEGKPYQVKITRGCENSPRYSDPFRFVPA